MADFLPKVHCALCGDPIDPPTECFRASGDFLPAGDPLNDFVNAPMHWPCYAEWPERRRFAKHHVDAWVRANQKNPFWWSVLRDEHLYISVNPQRPVEEASIRLYAWGNDVRVPLPFWRQWLTNMNDITPNLHAYEKDALTALLPTLRERFPTDHTVVDAIDPAEKATGRRKATAGARR
jgi:hypothetical protein